MSESMKRLFIAVDLPESVIGQMIKIQHYFQKKALFEGRYPAPEAMHLTIKFIGEVPTNKVDHIQESLRTIKAVPMRCQLDSINFFGEPRYMKILYVSCSCPGLADLVHTMDELLSDIVPPESRDFSAHLTIARIKHVYDPEALLEAIELCPFEPAIFSIDSFVLKQSVLSSEGPESDIERYPLSFLP